MVEMVGTRNGVLASVVHHTPSWEREREMGLYCRWLFGWWLLHYVTTNILLFYSLLLGSFWSPFNIADWSVPFRSFLLLRLFSFWTIYMTLSTDTKEVSSFTYMFHTAQEREPWKWNISIFLLKGDITLERETDISLSVTGRGGRRESIPSFLSSLSLQPIFAPPFFPPKKLSH